MGVNGGTVGKPYNCMQFIKKYVVATSHARTCISAASRVKTHIGTTSGLPLALCLLALCYVW